ncbi:MAG: phosphatidate cytidylyltransferase [Sphingobium sp.]
MADDPLTGGDVQPQTAQPQNAQPQHVRPNSDLRVRLMSAAVMIVVAGAALSLGGLPLRLFIVLVGIGLIYEFAGLVRGFATSAGQVSFWMLAGIAYIGLACFSLITMPAVMRWTIIAAVIATDTGAYFAGRRFGGARIAPAISPSKTWAGLYGGMAGAALVLLGAWLIVSVRIDDAYHMGYSLTGIVGRYPLMAVGLILAGCALAVVAQAGDFFESWMKRRAGVKDSGALIPGHGGLFDRVDGLLAVSAVAGIMMGTGLI